MATRPKNGWPVTLTQTLTGLSIIVIVCSGVLHADRRYSKQHDFNSLVAKHTADTKELADRNRDLGYYTRRNFLEMHLERTQDTINQIKATPESQRESWQSTELLRLESVKERQIREIDRLDKISRGLQHENTPKSSDSRVAVAKENAANGG